MPETIDAEAFVRFEASGWSRVGDAYHRFFGPVTGQVVEPLLDTADVSQGSRVLDVATGPGYVAGRAAARGAIVLGVDLAPELLALARQLWPEVMFRPGDAHALPLDDDRFDAVVANFLVPHLADHARAVGELVRVLAPGGRLALTTWDRPERVPLLGALVVAARQAHVKPPPAIPAGPDFFRFSEDAAFAALLEAAGLVEVGVRALTFSHRVPTVAAAWAGVTEGTVRTAALVAGQPPAVQRRVRAAFETALEPYQSRDGLDLPVSVKIASGRKP